MTYHFAVQGFEVTHRILMTLQTRLPDSFHHLVPNDNFHCQMPWENDQFDLFSSENVSWQMWLRIENG